MSIGPAAHDRLRGRRHRRAGRVLPRERIPRGRPHDDRRGARVAARRVRRVRGGAAQRLPRPTLRRRPALRQHRGARARAAAVSRSGACKGVNDTAMYRNGRRIAAKLLDVPEADIEHWGHLIFKPPSVGAATPWHQDEAYWSRRPLVPRGRRVDAARRHRRRERLPVVRARIRTRARCSRTATSATTPPCTSSSSRTRSTSRPRCRCRCRAGGGSFHHPRTIHGARPNTTDRRRRAWANEYQLAPVKLDVPADRPWVQDGHDAMMKRLKTTT